MTTTVSSSDVKSTFLLLFCLESSFDLQITVRQRWTCELVHTPTDFNLFRLILVWLPKNRVHGFCSIDSIAPHSDFKGCSTMINHEISRQPIFRHTHRVLIQGIDHNCYSNGVSNGIPHIPTPYRKPMWYVRECAATRCSCGGPKIVCRCQGGASKTFSALPV